MKTINFGILAFCFVSQFNTACFAEDISLSGKLELRNDNFVLVIEKPITVKKENEDVTSNRVQLAGLGVSEIERLKPQIGTTISLAGEVIPATGREHTEKLVIYPEEIPQKTVYVEGPRPTPKPTSHTLPSIEDNRSSTLTVLPETNINVTQTNILFLTDIEVRSTETNITNTQINFFEKGERRTSHPKRPKNMIGLWREDISNLINRAAVSIHLKEDGTASMSVGNRDFWTAKADGVTGDLAEWTLEQQRGHDQLRLVHADGSSLNLPIRSWSSSMMIIDADGVVLNLSKQ